MQTPSRKTILVVDDDFMMTLFLEQYLGQTYDVVTQSSAADALAWLRNGAPADLIVTDLSMPDMDGFALARAVRSERDLADVPVMMLSGSEKSQDRVRCLEIGADDFLTKPFNPEELTARIAVLFRRLRRPELVA